MKWCESLAIHSKKSFLSRFYEYDSVVYVKNDPQPRLIELAMFKTVVLNLLELAAHYLFFRSLAAHLSFK